MTNAKGKQSINSLTWLLWEIEGQKYLCSYVPVSLWSNVREMVSNLEIPINIRSMEYHQISS